MRYLFYFFIVVFLQIHTSLPPFLTETYQARATEVLNSLSLSQKIGQLFMMKVKNSLSPSEIQDYKEFIDGYSIGGIFLHGGGALKDQLSLIESLTSSTKIPLLIGQDLEWGLSMRLEKEVNFPRALTLGAIQDPQLIYKLGQEIGRQCKAAGITLNAAPVVDINTNPQNPVIGFRSFGDNKDAVALKSVAFIKGLQDEHILACAKHFPGHGDTYVDSHRDLPVVNHTQERLEEIELFPFKEAINNGVSSIMSAHIKVDAYDTEKPATLSKKIITDVLKNDLSFQGLCITDALRMKAIKNNYPSVQANCDAFLAGNDILLYAKDIAETIVHLYSLIQNNPSLEIQLNNSVLKILQAKQWVQENHSNFLNPTYDEIHSAEVYKLKKELYQAAITLVHQNNFTPLQREQKYCLFNLGYSFDAFKTYLQQTIPPFHSYTFMNTTDLANFTHSLDKNPLIIPDNSSFICTLFTTQRGYVEPPFIDFINTLHKKNSPVTVVLCGSPYTLSSLDSTIPTLVAYEIDSDAQEAAASVLLGEKQAIGRLPIHL